MSITSDAHFAVVGHSATAVIDELRSALAEFDAAHHGVSGVQVIGAGADGFVVRLALVSADAAEADADADRAAEAITVLIRLRFPAGTVRERQRELTLP